MLFFWFELQDWRFPPKSTPPRNPGRLIGENSSRKRALRLFTAPVDKRRPFHSSESPSDDRCTQLLGQRMRKCVSSGSSYRPETCVSRRLPPPPADF